ncbi:hypothetical protein XELAEV_18025129mg [Xenopus laevis]|uniref:Secreted protein n=1 Tax=Xenopus laevis TaxID=8355 RepID=A0A974D1J1_XENLA|nr:hypothetical protein XELAEV_18025129mg [Xenopus laevis]
MSPIFFPIWTFSPTPPPSILAAWILGVVVLKQPEGCRFDVPCLYFEVVCVSIGTADNTSTARGLKHVPSPCGTNKTKLLDMTCFVLFCFLSFSFTDDLNQLHDIQMYNKCNTISYFIAVFDSLQRTMILFC